VLLACRIKFVKRELMDIDTAQGMLSWPHSGFHTHDGVWAAAEDKEFAVRLARYCARNPIALSRMEYDGQHGAVTFHSDKPTGSTAGSETTDAPSFPGSTHQSHPGVVIWARLTKTIHALSYTIRWPDT
jgi:hypothetical protein